MTSAYPHYRTRIVHRLDGVWEMAVIGDHEPDTVDLSKLTFSHLMAVPGVYDAQSDLAGLRGLVAVRCRLQTTPGRRGRLHFGGMGLWGRVFIDGVALDDCHLPYCPWSVAVPVSDQSEREVIVLLDNRMGPERALLFDPFFDWYAHGGLYRSVSWHELPEVAFDRATITTTDVVRGAVDIDIRFDGLEEGQVDLLLSWDNGPEKEHRIAVRDGCAQLRTTVPNASPWTPATPHLHELHLKLADRSDDLIERTGLRKLETSEGHILLNGEALQLRGVNRHEYGRHTGPALSDGDIIHDLSLLREMGANFVRGSHYQQDQRFLDRCDELGIIVWEEGLGWQPREEHFVNPRFAALQEEQLRRMVRASCNHPSVIMWGFLNEGHSQLESSRSVYRKLAASLREEDPSRLVTYACNHPFDCLNLELCDVVSINQYPGWYSADLDTPHPIGEIEGHLNKVLRHLEEQGLGDKPKILSEIGAGAIYGNRDDFGSHWSEEYQAACLEEICRCVDSDSRWMGLALWQFCDVRTYAGARAMGRPRCFNNKGLVDEFRRRKLGFTAVKAAFRKDTR